ncbi:MAG: hypothetical protein ACAI35_18150 [Candidatus Methylacidiphilales bacterium]|nr:hypothetical protein [Candidatus Methylacidiphilales bacterium]
MPFLLKTISKAILAISVCCLRPVSYAIATTCVVSTFALALPLGVSPCHAETFEISPRLGGRVTVADFRCVIPDGVKTVRGIIVLMPGYEGDGRGAVGDKEWQALASKHQLALVAGFMKGPDYHSANEGGKMLVDAIKMFATQSKHPEIDKVPMAFWGHSAGGQFAYNFAVWKPRRTLAFVVNKGGYYTTDSPSADVLKTPGIFFMGTNDEAFRVKRITEIYTDGRKRGARWCMVPEEGVGHGLGVSKKAGLEFIDKAFQKRLPVAANSEFGSDFGTSPASTDPKMNELVEKDGLLGNPATGEATAYDLFSGSKAAASWLMDQEFAASWKAALKK